MVDPKHKYVFEIFFYLGEGRNLTKLSRIQMTKLYPDVEQDTEEYKTKFNTIYKKYARWAQKENWHEEAQKREEIDRSHRSNVLRKEEETLSNTVQLYRRMVRFMLQQFAEDVVKNKVQLKTVREAKQMIELDMYLSQIIDRRPKALSAQVLEMMTEKERRGADKVFEWLHKRANRASAIEDLGEVVEAEQELEEHAQTTKLLTPPKEVPEKEPIVQDLNRAEALEKYRKKKEEVRKRRLERTKRLLQGNMPEIEEETFLEDDTHTGAGEDSASEKETFLEPKKKRTVEDKFTGKGLLDDVLRNIDEHGLSDDEE